MTCESEQRVPPKHRFADYQKQNIAGHHRRKHHRNRQNEDRGFLARKCLRARTYEIGMPIRMVTMVAQDAT